MLCNIVYLSLSLVSKLLIQQLSRVGAGYLLGAVLRHLMVFNLMEKGA